MIPEKLSNGTIEMRCPACGKTINPNSGSFEIKQKIRHSEQEKMIVIEDPDVVETMPTSNQTCSKCGHNVAVYWQVQTRSGDEASTTFYRCKKCKNTWRDYG